MRLLRKPLQFANPCVWSKLLANNRNQKLSFRCGKQGTEIKRVIAYRRSVPVIKFHEFRGSPLV